MIKVRFDGDSTPFFPRVLRGYEPLPDPAWRRIVRRAVDAAWFVIDSIVGV